MSQIRHPAKFSDVLIEEITKLLEKYKITDIYDPFAGTGKLVNVRKFGYKGTIVLSDLEKEWLHQVYQNQYYDHSNTEVFIGDATCMWLFNDNVGHCIVTSPVYGNRMSDHHNAKDNSKRNTYKHSLGRDLHKNNAGQMHFYPEPDKRGKEYRDLHEKVWKECHRVIRKGGYLILNISNFIRNDQEVDVTKWHCEILEECGFEEIERLQVKTKRLRQGANGKKRVDYENVIVFRKK